MSAEERATDERDQTSPSELDLLYSDVEDDLRSTVRGLLAERCDPSAVIATYDGDRSIVDGLWKSLAADLGLAGLLVPEDRGGAGASAREAAVVLEEVGRAAAPVPYLTSAVVATVAVLGADDELEVPRIGALDRERVWAPGPARPRSEGALDSAPSDENAAGRDAQAREPSDPYPRNLLLPSLAAGERTAALVVPLSTPPDGSFATVAADSDRLSGTVTSVAGALEADVLLVPVATTDGFSVYAVSAADATVTPVASLDMTRQLADVTFAGAAGAVVVADGGPGVRRALEVGAALLASEQVGVARWCLDATVEYLQERRQFGRAVGGFQALKHRLADLYTGVESAVAAARYAAATIADDDPDVPVATAVAQAYCSDLAVTAAEEAVQLHGGIAMTWEHPAHLYLKRAKADQLAFGTAGTHRARLAGLVDLPKESA